MKLRIKLYSAISKEQTKYALMVGEVGVTTPEHIPYAGILEYLNQPSGEWTPIEFIQPEINMRK